MKQRNKQQGYTFIELLIVVVIIGVLSWIGLMAKNTLEFQQVKTQINTTIDLIVGDARAKRGAAPNFNVISDISVLCEDGYLNAATCGDNNNGKGSNPYGGDWIVAPSSTFGAAHLMVTITEIADSRFSELADILASKSYKNCLSATDCASIDITAPSENSNTGSITVHL